MLSVGSIVDDFAAIGKAHRELTGEKQWEAPSAIDSLLPKKVTKIVSHLAGTCLTCNNIGWQFKKHGSDWNWEECEVCGNPQGNAPPPLPGDDY